MMDTIIAVVVAYLGVWRVRFNESFIVLWGLGSEQALASASQQDP